MAKVKLILAWKVVKQRGHPYYGVVLLRWTDKEVRAEWPWRISDRDGNGINVFQVDPNGPYRLRAKTWSGFHAEWGIPGPGPIPDIVITKDMEIHVSVTAGLDNQGRATCWRTGYHT